MKLGSKQRMTLCEIAQAGDEWRHAELWHASVVAALRRRGLLEATEVRALGADPIRLVRATPAGLVLGHGGGEDER